MEINNEFIKKYERLVYGPAYYFAEKTGMEFEDLVQEGIIGMMRAGQKYDPSRGVEFSTYAMYWINQSIRSAIRDKGNLIRIPQHSDKKQDESYKARYASKDVTSMDAEVGKFDKTMHDYLPDEKTKRPDQIVEEDELIAVQRAELSEKMKLLKPRNRFVVSLYFGLYDGQKYTLEEIRNQLDLSRERVRQLRDDALKTLKLKYGVDEPKKAKCPTKHGLRGKETQNVK